MMGVARVVAGMAGALVVAVPLTAQVTGPTQADVQPLKHGALGRQDAVWVGFGAQLRTRVESWRNFGFDAALGHNDDFVLYRVLLNADLHLGKRLRGFVEAKSALLTDRNLLAIPVVDDDDHLLGIITEDDVADVLLEEAAEDIERLGGSQPLEVPYRLASLPLLVRKRLPWLLLLFVAGAYTGTVMQAFQAELAQAVALAFFIPLLIGTGGNIGSQTVTLIVRSMALGEVTLRDIAWIIWKEIRVGLALGAIMAVIAFGRAALLGVGNDVGAVVAVAILAISLWSATVAATLPLILRRIGIDPAVVSAPLITTLVDGTGLVIYFETARVMLAL